MNVLLTIVYLLSSNALLRKKYEILLNSLIKYAFMDTSPLDQEYERRLVEDCLTIYSNQLTEFGYDGWIESISAPHLPKLTSLSLGDLNGRFRGEVGKALITAGLNTIRKLKIIHHSNTGYPFTASLNLAGNWTIPNLETLHISHAHQDVTAKLIQTHSQTIKDLLVKETTPHLLENDILQLPKLEKLNLEEVSHEIMEKIVRAGQNTLELLDIVNIEMDLDSDLMEDCLHDCIEDMYKILFIDYFNKMDIQLPNLKIGYFHSDL